MIVELGVYEKGRQMSKTEKKRMENEKERKGLTWNYIWKYSVVMVVLFGAVFSGFLIGDKSFIWIGDSGDGLVQHYNALAYYGEYLRGIAKNLVTNGTFTLPMWDMCIGYGSDIITTLHYYVIGDPLNLLSVFVPKMYTEYLYNALILVRIYLAGMAFSAYSFSRKNGKFATLLGGVSYCFCGYVLQIAIKHPYFVNPMIYFPMLLLGVDKIYKKEKPHIFIITIALAGMSNFYFFYMLGIFVVLYAAVRYIAEFKKIEWKVLFTWLGKFIAFGLIGLMMAALILMPVVLSSMGTDRFGVTFALPKLYRAEYYGDFFTMFTNGKAKYYTILGYTAISFLAIVVLFMQKKKHTLLKILFLVMTICLCIPYAGHCLNGFSYVTNRWIWAYSMVIAYMVVKAVPTFWELSVQKKKILAAISIGYGLFCVGMERQMSTCVAVALLGVACGTICLLKKDVVSTKIRNLCLLALYGICILSNGYFLYSSNGANYMEQFIERGRAWETMTEETPESSVEAVMKMDSPYRYDKSHKSKGYENVAVALSRHGVGYYFSLDQSSVSQFLDEMQLRSVSGHHYAGLDNRSMLEAVSSVKYFVAKDWEKRTIPQFYKNKKIPGKHGHVVYEGEALPIGFTYDTYVPRKVYDTLTVSQKQQALLQGAVLEGSREKETKLKFYDRIVPYTVQAGDGIEVKKRGIRVKKKKATMTLQCNGGTAGEWYVQFKNLHYRHKRKSSCKIWIKAGKCENVLPVKNNKNNFYAAKHDFLVNAGNFKEPVKNIEITFGRKGFYRFSDIQIISQPMEEMYKYLEQRRKTVLEDISYSTNQIQGNINVGDSKILYFSIPYSKGWRVYVDGKEQTLQQANTLGMAIELEQGQHKILLKYSTPYLKEGAILSLLGWIVFVGLLVCGKKWD